MTDHPTRPEIQLLDGAFYAADPLEHFRWMRANAPVYWDGEVWGITLHEDILTVSKNPSVFCSSKGSRPEPGSYVPSMINMDDPKHRRRRNLVNRGFTPRRVAAHEPKIRRICHELVDRVEEKGQCEFVRDIAAPLPMIVIGDMLGVEPEDRDKLLRWSEEMLAATSATATEDERAAAMQAGGAYATYLLDVAGKRRTEPTDDLVSVLVHAEIEGEKLDTEALIHESLLILVGGDETTRHVITGGMRALIAHPDQRQRLVEDLATIPIAVEEMLRWVSPISNMNRTALRDTELRGQHIREGDRLLMMYPSANRDERVFERPDEFDTTRDPNEHVAFGGYGAHFCLGSSLARLELRVMFETLLERLPDLELDTDEPLPIRASNFIAGIEEMPVRFPPR